MLYENKLTNLVFKTKKIVQNTRTIETKKIKNQRTIVTKNIAMKHKDHVKRTQLD